MQYSMGGLQPMTDELLKHKAPSVFAETPWHDMSQKYSFVPTIDIVRGMQKEGFQVMSATQSRSRIEGKREFTKHMLRFRKTDQQVSVNGTFPEIVLVNSHDGTSAYKLYAGFFRLVCANGMVCAMGQREEYKTRHSGDIQGEVIEASYKIVDEFPGLVDAVTTWQRQQITQAQQIAYAESALTLRWEAEQAKPEPVQLLAVRRVADRAEENTVWGTYNRVQEALIRGGNRIKTDGYRRVRSRAVTGIDQDVKLNRALWTLTEKMAALV